MTLRLACEIEVGPYLFRAVEGLEIMTSWKELGDSARIRLPNLKGLLEKANPPIETGQPVIIRLGYQKQKDSKPQLREEFRGYIARRLPNTPYELECEDESYNLKRTTISKAWKSITLKALLKELVPTVQLSKQLPDITLSPVRFDRITIAQAIMKLKEDYKLSAYFRAGVLFVGIAYTEFTTSGSLEDYRAGKRASYELQTNIVSQNLTFQRKEDVKLKAKAISILPNNKRLEVEVGDPEGETRTLHYRNITSKDALKKLAEEDLLRYKYDGYTGSITGYGLPYIIHSGTAEVEDKRYPERKGNYAVESVKTTFGSGGFRREVQLGIKVG